MSQPLDLQRFVGWYDDASQKEPTHDPAHDGPCIVCIKPLTPDNVRTVSVLAEGGTRSLFYRLHRTCAEALSERDAGDLDEAVMNAAPRLVEVSP